MMAILVSAWAAEANNEAARTVRNNRVNVWIFVFMRKGSLKGPFVPDAELEPARTAGVGPMRDGKRIVQPQGTQLRNVESDSDTPVVVERAGVETMRVKAVCILIDHTDVIKCRKAQSFDNGHTVLRRS